MANDSTDDFLTELAGMSKTLKHTKSIRPDKNDDGTDIDNVSLDDIEELDDAINDTEETEETEEAENIEMVESTETAVTTVENTIPSVQESQISISDPNSKEQLQDYVISKGKKLIAQGFDTLEGLQDTVVNTCDGKAINGYATLVASLGKILDTVNSIGMEKSRIDSSIEMENLKHAHKNQLKSMESPTQKNTVNIVAGREEIMKMLANSMD